MQQSKITVKEFVKFIEWTYDHWSENWYVDDLKVRVENRIVPSSKNWNSSFYYCMYEPDDIVTIMSGEIRNNLSDFTDNLKDAFYRWKSPNDYVAPNQEERIIELERQVANILAVLEINKRKLLSL